ncbi:hypothetical protein [Flaviflexus massiliensis]|uniref:hypothetical protein n=1 Tax=Flaviflexus massiliensis TaxID=1522309 RepID=UPI001C9C1DC5|nr:hypothetical protein [Flaviflexus massiliensis]
MIMWYAFDETGRFVYRSGVKRGAKGTGKDPFAAAMMLIEFIGPSQLVWDARLGWTGVRHRMPLVQVGANSEAQAKDTMRIANSMLSKEARRYYEVDCGETATKLQDGTGGRMEVLTWSEGSTEGDPATFIALNESHHMTGSGGHAIAAVARRNVGKSPRELQARLVEFTNAHRRGGDSAAERSFEAWQKQVSNKALLQDILYDSIEADPRLRIHVPDELKLGIEQAYSDAPWADTERLQAEALDARTSAGDTIRFYFNGLAAAEDAWVDPGKVDGLMMEDAVLEDREAIAIFADLSKSEDSTAVVACRLSDSAFFVLGVWQKPHGDRGKTWLAPRDEVKAAILEADERYRVVWLGVDPSPAEDDATEALYWQEMLDELHQHFSKKLKVWATPGRGGSSILFDMRMSQTGGKSRNEEFTKTAMLVATLIDESDPSNGVIPFTLEANPILRRHMHNAKRRPNLWGFTLGKETRDSPRKVDLAVCVVGARLGRDRALNSGKVKSGRKRRTARRRTAIFA